MLTSCGGSPTVTASGFCEVAGQVPYPLTYSSSRDTQETRDGIDRANAAWLCLCQHDCPQE